MTKRDEHARAGKSGCEHCLWGCCGHTGKTGDCGDRQGWQRNGPVADPNASLMRIEPGLFVLLSPLHGPARFFLLSLYPLPPTPIMLNRRQQSTAPAASSNAPPAGKLFFMPFLVSGQIVPSWPWARNTASCPQMALFCASAQSSCVPQSPSQTPLQPATGSCFLPSPFIPIPSLRCQGLPVYFSLLDKIYSFGSVTDCPLSPPPFLPLCLLSNRVTLILATEF